MKTTTVCMILLIVGMRLAAQSRPDLRFGGHTLGETAESFFSSAKTESGANSKAYCTTLLGDPGTDEKLRTAQDSMATQGSYTLKKPDFALLDVGNCRQLIAALRGEQAAVGARLASELGAGTALFASGKLMALNLHFEKDYSDVVSDMERRFGFSGKTVEVTPVGWPAVHEEVRWEAAGVLVEVCKIPYSKGTVVYIGYLQPPFDSLLLGR